MLAMLFLTPADSERCFKEVNEAERKVFYYHGKATQLKILTGSGEESRLIAATFKIFASEVLGYQFTLVTEEQERNESVETDDEVGISREFDTAAVSTTTNNNEYPN